MSWLDFSSVLELLKSGWRDFIGTDFSQMNFSNSKLAILIGVTLGFLIVLKLLFVLFGRNKYVRADSGHLIYQKNDVGFLPRFMIALPSLFLVVTLASVLIAISGPFFTSTKDEKKYIETRTRVDVQDVSGSMTVVSGDISSGSTHKTKAEVSMDAHLKFLEMRKGKKDRTSFWIFSDHAFLKQDFTIDEDLFYFQVYDAPWELGTNPRDSFNWSAIPFSYYSKFRYQQIDGEGGTQMSSVLHSVVKQFDEDDARQKQSPYYKPPAGRALLILTDSEISDFEQAKKEVEALKARRVIIYIILIRERPTQASPTNPSPDPYADPDQSDGSIEYQILPKASATPTNPILDEIVRQGGKFFPVYDESSLLDAYREIDSLEKVKTEVEKKIFKVPVFYKFVFIGIMSLIIIIPGLVAVYLIEYP